MVSAIGDFFTVFFGGVAIVLAYIGYERNNWAYAPFVFLFILLCWMSARKIPNDRG